jgi:hypothetical protein
LFEETATKAVVEVVGELGNALTKPGELVNIAWRTEVSNLDESA